MFNIASHFNPTRREQYNLWLTQINVKMFYVK